MGTLLFGTDDTITCIQHLEIKGPDNESLCLAHKFSKLFIGAGVKLSDDGYVLAVDSNKGKVTTYFKLDAAKIKELQSTAALPNPLPSYQIPWFEYAFGYSLWIVLVITAIWYKAAAMLKTRRLQARAAEVASRPISYGPPLIETKEDRFIQEQVAPLLEAGETVQHQAYTFDRVPEGGALQQARTTARFVALTNRRLFLFDARVGALGILLENKKTEALPRTRIAHVAVDDRIIHLVVDDGSVRTLWVHKTKKLSNQHAFLLDVPRMLAVAPSAVAV